MENATHPEDDVRRSRIAKVKERRFEALMDLLDRRHELQGLNQTADYMVESVLWSA